MRPADQRHARIEDDGDAEVEPAATIEDEIPTGDPITLGPVDGLEAQVGEPALDVGRAHGRRAGVGGRHGPRSLADSSRGAVHGATRRRAVHGAPRPRAVRLSARGHRLFHCQVAPVGVRMPTTGLHIDGFAALDDLLRPVADSDVGGDLHVAPDPSAARHDRALADDRDPAIEAARFLLVRPIVERTTADHGALADDDLLVEDGSIDDRLKNAASVRVRATGRRPRDDARGIAGGAFSRPAIRRVTLE